MPLYSPAAKTRRQIALTARNIKDENFPFSNANATTTAASQAIHFALVGANAGDQLNNVIVEPAVLGTSTAPTAIYVAAYSTAGALLAVSANLNSNTIWTAATGPQLAPLTTFSAVAGVTDSGGRFVADVAFYLAFLQNGAFAGTALQLSRFATNATIFKAVSGGVIPVGNQTGQTTMPSTATIVVSGQSNIWMAWN